MEFSHDGNLLATGDKGGRVVIFQREDCAKKTSTGGGHGRKGEYSVYTTFQSHEPEFDYLKSLEIEEKINKIRWLKKKNAANFLLSTNDKTIKLWKVTEKDKQLDGTSNLIRTPKTSTITGDDSDTSLQLNNSISSTGSSSPPPQLHPAIRSFSSLRVPSIKPMDLVVEATPRRVYANAHTYHVNSISVNSDQETFLSADDLRINIWHQDITDESFNIVDIKPANMEELTEVITAAEFHPVHCNQFVYSSSKGILRLCDMRAAALCDQHAKGKLHSY